MPKATPEQLKAAEKIKALKEAQKKYAEACAEYHEKLLEVEPGDLQELSAYTPFAEQITHSDASQATIAGVLARVLRLEVKAGIRDEVPVFEPPQE